MFWLINALRFYCQFFRQKIVLFGQTLPTGNLSQPNDILGILVIAGWPIFWNQRLKNWTLGIALLCLGSACTKESSQPLKISDPKPSNTLSSITYDRTSAIAGVETITATIRMLSGSGIPLSGFTPQIVVSGSNNTTACTSSNSQGMATCTIESTTVESKTVAVLTPVQLSGDDIAFTHGPAHSIVLTTQPGNGMATVALTQQPIAEIRDLNGNRVTSGADSIATVTATLTTGTGAMAGTTSISAVSGVVSFTNLSFNLVGSKNITLTKTDTSGSGGTPSLQVVSSAFQIDPAGASALTSTITGTGPVIANGIATSTVTITLLDPNSNPVSGETPTFSATNTGSTNSYGACSASNASGISTCTLRSTVAEVKTLSLLTPVSVTGGNVTFTHGPASQLVITTQPGGGASEAVWAQQPVVEVRDANGNRVNSGVDATVSISVAISTGTGTLSGTHPLNASGGIASFTDLTMNLIGSKNLRFIKANTTGSGGTASFSVISNAFSISAGSPSASTSTITGTGPVQANGVATSTVTITLLDASSNPVSGVTPTFLATNTQSGNSYGTCSTSNASGVSTCTLASTYGETKTLSIATPVVKSDGTVFFSSSFQVPIEMLADSLSSETTAGGTVFERTRTSLNTGNFTGISNQYYFEVVASNQNTTETYAVSIVDSSDTELAAVTVPANTLTTTRLSRVAFTPTVGADTYRVKLPQTGFMGDVVVTNARILIDQVGASATQIYIPLFSTTAAPDQTTSATYTQGQSSFYTYWNKVASEYATLSAGTPWTFEALLASSDASSFVNAALFNVTSGGLIVPESVLQVTGVTPQLVSQSFASAATNFTDSADFEVRLQSSDPLYTASLYKAGIWVQVTNPEKLMIPYRVAVTESSASSVFFTAQRMLWSAGLFTSPKVYFESVGLNTQSSGGIIRLYQHSTNDSGTTAGSDVVLSSIDWVGTTKQRLRTGELSLVNNNRYFARKIRIDGTVQVSDSKVWIGVGQ